MLPLVYAVAGFLCARIPDSLTRVFNDLGSMTSFDQYREPLFRLREIVPALVDMLHIEDAVSGEVWKNFDARLLPLVDPNLPLMVAICGGANAGKSTLFNSLLNERVSPVRGNAGSTRRVLIAVNPQMIEHKSILSSLFDPFGQTPSPVQDPVDLMTPGPPLVTVHEETPKGQILMDTPDFDTGSDDRFVNRDVAREVLEACNVLIYIVTNTTYNNLENTRFMRHILTEAGMRRCILVYNCSRTLDDRQVRAHLKTTATNLYGAAKDEYLIGCYRTDTSDAVAAGEALMRLRPVPAGEPDIMNLLADLDPRQIRERQIQTMLEAFVRHVGQVVTESKTVRDEIDLYTGALHLTLGRAVQQSLVSFPLKSIMRRLNDIWLETSPPHLKFFRGVGNLIGKPARVILSLVKPSVDGDAGENSGTAGTVDPLERIKSDLLGSAAELRDSLLAEEIIVETIAKDAIGVRLITLVDRIRLQRDLSEKELPSRHIASATGTVTVHAAAPVCSKKIRHDLDRRPWTDTAQWVIAAAKDVLDISEDTALNEELTNLVGEFRRRMNFLQKTRESFFASLNVLPATLGIAYILTTGDPVGGSGIYAKLHGLFGMHDLWALVSIPASAGIDETGRKDLSDMLEPVVKRWIENRAHIVKQVFEETIAGEVIRQMENTAADAAKLTLAVEETLASIS